MFKKLTRVAITVFSHRNRMGYLRDVRRTLSAFDAFKEVRDVVDAIDIVLGYRHRIMYRRMVRWLCCYRTNPLSAIDSGDARKLRGHVLCALGSLGSNADINAKDIERLIQTLRYILNCLPSNSKDVRVQGPAAYMFYEPVHVSMELGSFLNLDRSRTYSKVFVIRKIYDYIIDNNLRDCRDYRVVRADLPLKALFCIPDDEEVTYFKVGLYLEHHFAKVHQKN